MANIHAHQASSLTTEPISAQCGQGSSSYPEFLRLPRVGKRCPLCGLSRSSLNALILGSHPPVKSVCLRQRGSQRGVRLIVTASLLDYLHAQTDHINEEVS